MGIRVRVHVCACMYVCMYVCVYVCMYVFESLCTCIRMRVRVWAHLLAQLCVSRAESAYSIREYACGEAGAVSVV